MTVFYVADNQVRLYRDVSYISIYSLSLYFIAPPPPHRYIYLFIYFYVSSLILIVGKET